jgi:hypothetical protein
MSEDLTDIVVGFGIGAVIGLVVCGAHPGLDFFTTESQGDLTP